MNPALPELVQALAHLKFAHGLSVDARQTATLGELCEQVGLLIEINLDKEPPLED